MPAYKDYQDGDTVLVLCNEAGCGGFSQDFSFDDERHGIVDDAVELHDDWHGFNDGDELGELPPDPDCLACGDQGCVGCEGDDVNTRTVTFTVEVAVSAEYLADQGVERVRREVEKAIEINTVFTADVSECQED